MRNQILILSALILPIISVGCTNTIPAIKDTIRETKVRHYLQDKKRVDLNMIGNAGYLAGRPDVVPGPIKDTRKIYVVEVTRNLNDGIEQEWLGSDTEVQTVVVGDRVYSQTTTTKVIDDSPDINIPKFEDDDDWGFEEEELNEVTEYVDYVVEKDDTLQKISKKFYNSYSKWTAIYDANRDVITDANFVKPGITIKIPGIK
ncbi:MAG: LysM repeat protein [Candidatus Omnitrophota bacterium]|jgi:LysM repeat protein